MKKSGEVRIIGGQWKRSKLTVADADGLRPTPDRVRETVFNWLGQELNGWRCLDMFAGTGSLGFEAASRGASEVVLLEKNCVVFQHLLKMKQQLNATQVDVFCTDSLNYLTNSDDQLWDLIFIDPPFRLDIFEKVLEIAEKKIAQTGAIYLESNRIITPPSSLTCYRQAKAGAVYYTLFVLSK